MSTEGDMWLVRLVVGMSTLMMLTGLAIVRVKEPVPPPLELAPKADRLFVDRWEVAWAVPTVEWPAAPAPVLASVTRAPSCQRVWFRWKGQMRWRCAR